MLNPCEDCIALAFGQAPLDADSLEDGNQAIQDKKSLSRGISPAQEDKPACDSIAICSRGNVDQDAGGVPRDPLESLGTPGPSGPSSPLLACPRHRQGGGWSILDPCQDCLMLAMQADL